MQAPAAIFILSAGDAPLIGVNYLKLRRAGWMQTLQAALGNRLLAGESLARYTAARLGGPADWLYLARDSSDELVEVVRTRLGWRAARARAGRRCQCPGLGCRCAWAGRHQSRQRVTFGAWHEGRNVAGQRRYRADRAGT